MRAAKTIVAFLITLGVFSFLAWSSLPSAAGASDANQEPVPTSTRPLPPPLHTATPSPMTPTATPLPRPSTPARGGAIELRAQLAWNWPQDETPWQNLWTVIQWQDRWGRWHDVEGWQGTLDRLVPGERGTGIKVWWVGESDLGTGPFRWLVYRERDGRLLARSKPFYLPQHARGMVAVQVAIAP